MEFDYDFSEVKPSELEPCLLYEFGRESRALIKQVRSERRNRKKIGVLGTSPPFPKTQSTIQRFLIIYLASAASFPETPWQNLSEKERTAFHGFTSGTRHTVRYLSTFYNRPMTFSVKETDNENLTEWREKILKHLAPEVNRDGLKIGFFALNMKYPRLVLIEEFAKYLTHFEGKAMSTTPPLEEEIAAAKIKQPPGRRSEYDALNALGAMRLRFYVITFSEALRKMKPLKGKTHGLYYGYRHSINRACLSALTHFNNLYAWIGPEKPIHWTTGWHTGAQKKKTISEAAQ